MTIGSPPPKDLENKNVLICDYSYKKDVLNDLLKKVNKLLVIDHHKSAEKDLLELDDKYKIFHMGHSGAMLTWFYFFPDVKPPLLIEYVQDRDIWTKLLPNTDDFASWFYTLPLEFKEYDKYIDDALLTNMIQVKGISYGELNKYYIEQALTYTTPRFCKIKNKFYFVAYVNSTICKSDIGNKIFDKFPLADFSAVYSISDHSDDTSFSLRSTDTKADVSEIAFSLGGGGHAQASGVRVNYVCNVLPGNIYDNGKLYNELQNIYYNTLDINGKTYNVVYLATSLHKTKLATYLLQNRYKQVQVCTDISTKLGNTCPDRAQIAAVWNYNPIDDTTKFTIVLDSSVNPIEKITINNYFKCDINYGVLCTGLHKLIPTDNSLIIQKFNNTETKIET
jgi:oligoribonuclease NrnB/cAMP/cGMP phosphodiesterase (DHH superfamily)